MRFKVGDKVKVRDDLEVDEMYGDLHFVDYMEQYKGQIVTINEVYDYYYCIVEDNCEMGWSDEMLEPINEETKSIKENNNKNEEKEMNIIESKQKEMEQLMAQFTKEMEEMKSSYQAKFDKLKEEIEQEKEKESEPFIKEGQEYYCIGSRFKVEDYSYDEYDCEKELISVGNFYPYTEENEEEVLKEVSLIAERRKLQSEMEMFARLNNEGEIDWNNSEQVKWYLYVDCLNKKLEINYYLYCRFMNETYFTSKEIAQQALKKFGDRIKKLYLDN